jgi:hypothetical protein
VFTKGEEFFAFHSIYKEKYHPPHMVPDSSFHIHSHSASNFNSIINRRSEMGGVGVGNAGDNGYSVLVWKFEEKRLLARSRRRRQDHENTGRA